MVKPGINQRLFQRYFGGVGLEMLDMRAEKNKTAAAVYEALVYQIAREIGAEVAVLRGKVDAIVFTGGMAREKEFIDDIKGYVGSFAKTIVYPGEFELEALAAYAAQVQSREIKPRTYEGKP
jgi:butyrate kinase